MKKLETLATKDAQHLAGKDSQQWTGGYDKNFTTADGGMISAQTRFTNLVYNFKWQYNSHLSHAINIIGKNRRKIKQFTKLIQTHC